MSQVISLPPACQWLCQMALSPWISTKSRLSAASFLSNSEAVTSTVSFWAKRRAVDFIIAKASGRSSLRITSIASSSSFTSLSDSVARASFSSMGMSSSIRAFISAMRSSKGFSTSKIFARRAALRSLKPSADNASISGYAARTF